MIPLMTSPRLLLRLTQHEAHGTSLFAVMATGLAGAISYSSCSNNHGDTTTKTGTPVPVAMDTTPSTTDETTTTKGSSTSSTTNNVRYEEAFIIALTGMITARYGAKATTYISSRHLKQALGTLMLLMAPAVPAKSYVMDHYSKKEEKQQQQQDSSINDNTCQHQQTGSSSSSSSVLSKPTGTITASLLFGNCQKYIAPACIGLCSGFLAGMFGIGGGVIVVPALTIFCTTTNNNDTTTKDDDTNGTTTTTGTTTTNVSMMTYKEALGTSLTAMILPALVGTVTHHQAGNIVFRNGIAPALACGAFVGSYYGGQYSQQVNDTYLKYGFMMILTTLGVRTILKA
jgi:uncharacterized membrane protein YfcA